MKKIGGSSFHCMYEVCLETGFERTSWRWFDENELCLKESWKKDGEMGLVILFYIPRNVFGYVYLLKEYSFISRRKPCVFV